MVKLYIEYLKLELKKCLEYKVSFILEFISQFFIFFTYYFSTLALFSKFSNIKGFTLYEVLLCFSIINFGYSFNEIFFRGVDHFEDFIIDGSLDRLLLRPRNVLFQVMSSKMDFVKLSRMLQSIIIFIICLKKLNIDFTILKVFSLILMLFSSVILFFGIFLLVASYCFITVHGLEVKNVLTDGGKHMSQYPMGIFKKEVRTIFTFVVPYALVNYYPLMYFLGKTNNILYLISPLLVVVYLIPCILIFNHGLKHYVSVGG